jgi:hypothetical protein
MENILKDKRFTHLVNDPKFRRIPKNEHKINIDKRFQLMFKDKNFAVKYTVDKRGRPINQTSTENLKKYYNISSSDDDVSVNNLECLVQKNKQKEETFLRNVEKSKEKRDSFNIKKSGTKEKHEEYFSDNSKTFFFEDNKQNSSDTDDSKPNKKMYNTKYKSPNNDKTRKKVHTDIKKKLQLLTVDYARGEGILSNTSSDEEISDCINEEQQINHNWGELDKETEKTSDITHRLALCNMDWDRIRAVDLMVLFNSFLPVGGLIVSVTIYPSEFGLKRMKDEEKNGPIELIEPINNVSYESNENNDSKTLRYYMEKLRKYQLNRLKYYYAVIVFDSANTANKIYLECDGLEYESSSTKLDLRFIPDNMTFNQEHKEYCNVLPNFVKYKPRQFTTTALQQVKVDLTWDETNPERQEITKKLFGKFDDIDKNDILAYLANGSSEDEVEDKVQKHLNGIDRTSMDDSSIDKYKTLLKYIEQDEKEKNNREVELEFTWGLGGKEKTENFVKEKLKNENLTPFQQYLKKLKSKKLTKREGKIKNSFNDIDESSADSLFSNTNLNDQYFTKPKSMKQKNISIKKDHKNKEINQQSELELLLMDEHKKSDKNHFNMKKIEEAESLKKSKKKCLTKRKRNLNEQASKDYFQINFNDSRFNALFTSYHYNIDPADPHYRNTKGTEALVHEKLKRRFQNNNVSIFIFMID